MIKYFCDCCGEEKKQLHSFSYLCHLDDKLGMDGYRDNEGNYISGRNNTKELCIKCYNIIVKESINKFNELSVLKGE